jgi:hypothetical protein
MPKGIGYGTEGGDSFAEALLGIATDPMYDVPTPDTTGALQPGIPDQQVSPSLSDYRMNPSYEAGGVVSANGPAPAPAPRPLPNTPGLTPAGAAPPMQQSGLQALQAEAQRIASQHPDQVQRMTQAISVALENGDMTPQELNMAVQMATAAAQNPQLWPQLRQFAIQQGMGSDELLPRQYDEGIVFSVLMAGEAAKASMPPGATGGQPPVGGAMPQSQGQPPQATMASGGPVPESRNADGSVAINAHKGEYVIPEHIVRAKGTEFFDKLVGKNEKPSA